MTDILGALLFLTLTALLTLGLALGVAVLHAVLARRPVPSAEVDAERVHAGRRALLRRWGTRWMVAAATWLALFLVTQWIQRP
ncbi:MAG TPA: hypothetical protein VLK84_01285 [Longimicrobium sp.]|nr:hypothetical protein [Longimicrobium sp.]